MKHGKKKVLCLTVIKMCQNREAAIKNDGNRFFLIPPASSAADVRPHLSHATESGFLKTRQCMGFIRDVCNCSVPRL